MKHAIEGFNVDKNSLPEVFGYAVKMWVLAPFKDPSRILLCTPNHLQGEVSMPALNGTGLLPSNCFFRVCMVEVTGSSEIVFDDSGDDHAAWQLDSGVYVVEENGNGK